MPQNVYELLWIFMIYAFLGWCTEVSYAALDRGIFVNRGFLNGPYCPIYGCGVVIVLTILTPLKENLCLLFSGSFLLTSLLEYITGYLLEKVFHNHWWDYSDKPFNIHGYVCLKFSVYWGLACTFIMDVLHPMIYHGILLIPHIAGVILVCIFMAVFIADCAITVATILKFNQRLRLMDEMAQRIHKLSDEIGENIYENVSDIVEKSGEFQETHAQLLDKLSETKDNLAELPGNVKEKFADTRGAAKEKITDTAANARLVLSENLMEAKSSLEVKKSAWSEKQKAELAELSEKYERMFEEKNFGFQRLMRAFPNMKSTENNRALKELKKHFHLDKPKQNQNKDGESDD